MFVTLWQSHCWTPLRSRGEQYDIEKLPVARFSQIATMSSVALSVYLLPSMVLPLSTCTHHTGRKFIVKLYWRHYTRGPGIPSQAQALAQAPAQAQALPNQPVRSSQVIVSFKLCFNHIHHFRRKPSNNTQKTRSIKSMYLRGFYT